MTKPKRAKGPQGIPGPPGPAGHVGKTGAVGPKGTQGRSGAVGHQGAMGARGKPGTTGETTSGLSRRRKLVQDVNNHIDDIYEELSTQMTRIAQIQHQVDELRVKLKRITEDSPAHRIRSVKNG